jgi:hypothetical protein
MKEGGWTRKTVLIFADVREGSAGVVKKRADPEFRIGA